MTQHYSPEVLAAFEAVYNDLWNRLYATSLREEEVTRELEIMLSQTLTKLVTDGVTQEDDLRRCAIDALSVQSEAL
jgi:hypothetical protein